MKQFATGLFCYLCISLPAFASDALVCKIGALPNWTPYYDTVSLDDSDLRFHKGPLIDYVSKLFEQIGAPYRFVAAKPRNRVLRDLEIGDVDVLVAGLGTKTRQEKFDLTLPIFRFTSGLIGLRKLLPEGDKRPLSELVLISFVSLKRDPSLNNIRENAKRVIDVDSVARALKLLDSGRGDYILANHRAVLDGAGVAAAEQEKFVLHPVHRVDTTIHMIFNRTSSCAAWIPQINTILANGEYRLP